VGLCAGDWLLCAAVDGQEALYGERAKSELMTLWREGNAEYCKKTECMGCRRSAYIDDTSGGHAVHQEVNWDLFDFAFMGTLLFGAGLTYELVARKMSTGAYRVAVGVAVVTAVLLVWINGAVGIIGDGRAVVK
jgi:hypothetical protein